MTAHGNQRLKLSRHGGTATASTVAAGSGKSYGKPHVNVADASGNGAGKSCRGT